MVERRFEVLREALARFEAPERFDAAERWEPRERDRDERRLLRPPLRRSDAGTSSVTTALVRTGICFASLWRRPLVPPTGCARR